MLQWIIGLIPDSILVWVYYFILTSGLALLAAGWLVKWFPVIGLYKTPLQLLGVALTAGSLYLLGGYNVEMAWRGRVAEMQKKVDDAVAQAAAANGAIEVKIVEKTKVIREKAKAQIEYIDRVIKEKEEIKIFIENCPIPKDIVDEHNKAAKGTAK